MTLARFRRGLEGSGIDRQVLKGYRRAKAERRLQPLAMAQSLISIEWMPLDAALFHR